MSRRYALDRIWAPAHCSLSSSRSLSFSRFICSGLPAFSEARYCVHRALYSAKCCFLIRLLCAMAISLKSPFRPSHQVRMDPSVGISPEAHCRAWFIFPQKSRSFQRLVLNFLNPVLMLTVERGDIRIKTRSWSETELTTCCLSLIHI